MSCYGGNLTYDPFAVTLRLRSRDGWVDWVVARCLLAEAVTQCADEADARALAVAEARQAAGEGDVRAALLRGPNGHQDRDRLWIELYAAAGRVVLLGEAAPARAVLYQCDKAGDEGWVVSTGSRDGTDGIAVTVCAFTAVAALELVLLARVQRRLRALREAGAS